MRSNNFIKTGLLANHLYDLGFAGVIWTSLFRQLLFEAKVSNDKYTYLLPKEGDIILLGDFGVPLAMINVLELDDLAHVYRLEKKPVEIISNSNRGAEGREQHEDTPTGFDSATIQKEIYTFEPLHFQTVLLESNAEDFSVKVSPSLDEILFSLGAKKRAPYKEGLLDGSHLSVLPALIDKNYNIEYLNLICRHIRKHALDRKHIPDRGVAGKILSALFKYQQAGYEKKYLYSLADGQENKVIYQYLARFINEARFNVLDLSTEQLDNLLNFSSSEKENLRGFEFAFKLLQADKIKQGQRVYIPFITSDALILETVRQLWPAELRCYSETDYLIADTLSEKYAKYIFAKKETEEILATGYTADLVILYPPFKEYIEDAKILERFIFYELMGDRKKVELEVLALEHSLRNLAPGGKLLAFVTNSILTSKRFTDIRQKILRETDIKAIISFPRGMLHPHWGYNVALIYLEKPQVDKGFSDHVLMGKIEAFEPDQIQKVLDKYMKGSNIK